MFYQLPPVGNTILSDRQAVGDAVTAACAPYTPRLLDSGTAALAAAVGAAVALGQTGSPEVILPAYGCPDLVSAVIHAGARPVLVDLEPSRPWLDLDGVAAALGPDTVAVVAVSLFGIPERMAELRALTAESGALLIEDSAQAFPRSGDTAFWSGDLVVISFGRGKPVSVLGGGAVLYRDSRFADLLPADDDAPPGNARSLAVKAWLYNRLLSPRLYWLPLALPFLHLGETRYHPLADITPMDRARQALLPANLAAYRQGPPDNGVAGLAGELDGTSEIIDLPRACAAPGGLLRYPLLVPAARRDALFYRLCRRGLGVSCMYPAPLPAISGLETILAGSAAFPAAGEFAARLLTLPLHAGVSRADIEAMRACLSK